MSDWEADSDGDGGGSGPAALPEWRPPPAPCAGSGEQARSPEPERAEARGGRRLEAWRPPEAGSAAARGPQTWQRRGEQGVEPLRFRLDSTVIGALIGAGRRDPPHAHAQAGGGGGKGTGGPGASCRGVGFPQCVCLAPSCVCPGVFSVSCPLSGVSTNLLP